ncbi:MAG: glucosaminidase domain-containing protein [Solirubrobacteraceae bacterium]|nr:glucosaminidase domain-containing protein [Solirubrobacteraceae bacterium]
MPRPTSLARAALAAAAVALAGPAGAVAQTGGGVEIGADPPADPVTTTTTTPTTITTDEAPEARKGKRPSSRGWIRLQSSKRINVRRIPSNRKRVGTLRRNAKIRVLCQMNAGPASGRYGRSRIWNRVRLPNGKAGYVPDASVEIEKSALVAPYCKWPDPGAPGRENPQQGRCSSVATVPLDEAPEDRAAFIKAAGPLARQSFAKTKVPASVSLAQGILESASGTLTAGANNYFGIKAQTVDAKKGDFRWGAQAVGCVHKPTYEEERGRLVRQIGQFRMYTGAKASFDDHGMFLVENSRYAKAFRYSAKPDRFAREIHRAGYATDSSYSRKLIKLMKDEKLYAYDR